jgi:hypothetical protein
VDIQLDKLQLCFLKCHEFGINLNPKKKCFHDVSRLIFEFIVSREGKFFNLKKVQVIINMLTLTTLA